MPREDVHRERYGEKRCEPRRSQDGQKRKAESCRPGQEERDCVVQVKRARDTSASGQKRAELSQKSRPDSKSRDERGCSNENKNSCEREGAQGHASAQSGHCKND